VILGEYGTQDTTVADQQWLAKLVTYLNGDFNGNGTSILSPGEFGPGSLYWTFGYADSAPGGLLASDWQTIDQNRLDTISPNLYGLVVGGSTTSVPFVVTLSGASDVPVSVSYTTVDNSASSPTDYLAASGTVTFNPGETSQVVWVSVNRNTTYKPDESFFLSLSMPVDATISRGQAQAIIRNDDAVPGLSVTYSPVTETVEVGGTVVLASAAAGNPMPTVKWQQSTDGGVTFTDIAGATFMTYSFVASTAQNGDRYRAVFTNSFGTATTAPAILTVLPPVSVTSVVVNGNLPALAGVQRSMVDSIVYNFSEAVNLAATGTDQNPAFAITVHTGEQGTAPTLAWAAINPDANGASTQWVVTFGGASVVGNSIANGVYDITLNPSAVTSEAHPTASITPRATDTFYRLYGDYNGDQVVNATDNLHFKNAITTYNPIFDYDNNGAVNATDNLHFKASISFVFNTFFTTTI
jgi:hypothetical protein